MFNRPLRPPLLHEDLPLYPPLSQLVRVTSTRIAGPSGSTGSSSAGIGVTFPYLYLGATQQATSEDDPVVGIHALIPRDREPCLVHDVVGDGLSEGYHLGRLTGSFGGLPIYTVVQRASTSFSGCRANFNTGAGSGYATVTNFGFTDATLVIGDGPIGAGFPAKHCYDDGGYWNSANPTRLTAPMDGKYTADYWVLWGIERTGFYAASIGSNSNYPFALSSDFATFDTVLAPTLFRHTGTWTGALDAGDYIYIRGSQGNPGGLTNSYTGWLSMTKIG